MTDKLDKLRDQLGRIKLKTFDDLENNLSNLDDIIHEYSCIAKTAKDLIKIKGKSVKESLTNQPSEYYFYKTCTGHLRRIVDYMEALVKYTRGTQYRKIRETQSRATDLNDRAINQLVDGNDDVRDKTSQYLKVKESYDTFMSIVDSYNQRGYALNNIVKSLEISVLDVIL